MCLGQKSEFKHFLFCFKYLNGLKLVFAFAIVFFLSFFVPLSLMTMMMVYDDHADPDYLYADGDDYGAAADGEWR